MSENSTNTVTPGPHPIKHQLTYVIGLVLIITGGSFLLERYLQTGWIILAITPVVGFALLFGGVTRRQRGYYIAGSLLLALGASLFFFFGRAAAWNWTQKLGWGILAFAAGWLLVTILSLTINRQVLLWPIIPAAILASIGFTFLYTTLRLLDFVLYTATTLGLVFLAIGLYRRWIGFIIPGSLLGTTGPAIYQAWGTSGAISALAKTGSMLVILAIGWGLITVFSRVITDKFTWWPLIPAGILAMTGWGLYIGGNPDNALGFIGNTGSIVLIILGIYLLLLRHGISR